MNPESIYVVEWSDYQQCFHIDTLSQSMRNNIEALICGQPIQFAMIGVSPTYEAAVQLRQTLEKTRSEQMSKIFNK